MEAQTTQPRISRMASIRRFAPVVPASVILVLSADELANLARVHTTGPELYGVLAAAIAVAAAAAGLVLIVRGDRPTWAVAVVLVLWAIVALAGLAGVVAHIVGPVPGHGPVDPRPLPLAAPLGFTLRAVVGAVALVLAQRLAVRQSR